MTGTTLLRSALPCAALLLAAVTLAAGLPDDAHAQLRDGAKDFDTLKEAGNTAPRGIWSDGTTMWVVDLGDEKVYAYNLATKNRDAPKDIELAASNFAPSDITSTGIGIWVSDIVTDKIYTYLVSSNGVGQHYPNRDFNTLRAAGNTSPLGMWSDGTTMYVSDGGDDKIYAYTVSSKSRDSAKEFDTLGGAGNSDPEGIWSDGTTMWVLDSVDTKIYAYKMDDKTLDTANGFDLAADNGSPTGIWSDGTTMYVVDAGDDKIYAYSMPGHDPREFNTLAANNTAPVGIWSDGTTMWVGDNTSGTIYAYNLATKSRDDPKDITAASNLLPLGIWSDGTTMWVSDGSADKIYAYNLATKDRDAPKDITLAASIAAWGIWSDGTTMWVGDWSVGEIYAYKMSDKSHDSSKDFGTLTTASNTDPRGIWSDGTTMWVADLGDVKIYAYNLATKNHDAPKDIALTAGNSAPGGIWSDGRTMWVADSAADKIYAYAMPVTVPDIGIDGPPVSDRGACNHVDAAAKPVDVGISDSGRVAWSYPVPAEDVPFYHFVQYASGTSPPAGHTGGAPIFDAQCSGADCRAQINGFRPDRHYLVAVDSSERSNCGYAPALARYAPPPPPAEEPEPEPPSQEPKPDPEPPHIRMSVTDDWDHFTVTVEVLSSDSPHLSYDWGHDGSGELRYTTSLTRVTYECGWDAATVHVRVTDASSGLSSKASAAVCFFDGEPPAQGPEPEPEPEPEPPSQEPEPDPEPPHIRMSVTDDWDHFTVTVEVLSSDSPHLSYDWGHDGSGDLVYTSSPGRVTYECSGDDLFEDPDDTAVTVHVRVTDAASGLSAEASATVCVFE